MPVNHGIMARGGTLGAPSPWCCGPRPVPVQRRTATLPASRLSANRRRRTHDNRSRSRSFNGTDRGADMSYRLVVLAAVAALLVGPARAATSLDAASPPAAADPLEDFNRSMYGFNKAVVERVLNPTVAAVSPYIPDPVVTGLGNAYNNLTEVEYILNGLLQRDPSMFATSVGRMAINSTVGLGGLLDVATRLGLPRETGDFGAALCSTGLPAGPYLVLPFVGPTNAISAPTLAGGVAIEVYLLSFISTTLAAADFLIIDLGGSAAALRYMTDIPPGADGYAIQRGDYQRYITASCGGEAGGGPVVAAAERSRQEVAGAAPGQ